MRIASCVCGAAGSRRFVGRFLTGVAGLLLVLAGGARAQEPQQLGHLPTSTRLAVAAGAASGQATLTVKVIGGDRGVPTGAVTLSSGSSSLGSRLLDENGTATFEVAGAVAQQVTAVYRGDGSFDASSSPATAVPAASAVPTFTLSAAPTTLTVKAGNYVTSTVTITPANGFVDAVLLSCTGLPVNSTCAFNPAIVTPNGTAPATTPASSILTIQTVAPSGSGALRPGVSGGTPIYAIALPGLFALGGLGLMRRRSFGTLRMVGVAVLLVGAGMGLSACSPRYSYFHHPPNLGPGTTLGTFTVMVNGSSGSAGTVIIPPAVPIVLTVD
jgi:Bacterial Ig-like domain (group 3)